MPPVSGSEAPPTVSAVEGATAEASKLAQAAGPASWPAEMPAIGIDEMSSATQRALTPGDHAHHVNDDDPESSTTLCRTPGGALLRGLRGRPCIQVQAEEIVQCIAFQDNWCQVRCDAGVGWLQTHLLHDYAEVEAQAARIRMLKEEIAERGGRIRMLEAQEARILLHPSA